MNIYYIRNDAILATLCLCVAAGAARYRKLDMGSRVFFVLCIFWLVTESAAYYAAIKYRNNLMVYNVSDLIELFLVCLYFNYTIPFFRKKYIGIILGLVSILVGIANSMFVQSIHSVTSFFLLYEALTTIIMAIISLSTFLNVEDTRNPLKEVHFWLPAILMLSWSLSYLLFTVIAFYGKNVPPAIATILFLVNIITNLSFTCVFLFYPKLNTHVR